MSEVASNQEPGGEQLPGAEAVVSTLGARLAAERKSREWSVEHVASQLNLAARQIQALEADNYAALPGMASVRGFVRAYAKLLKIDAAPLVAMIASEHITPTQPLEPKRQLAGASFSDNRMMSADHSRSSPKAIIAAIVVVLLALGAIVIERMGGWPTLSQSLSTQFKELSSPSATASNTSLPVPESVNASAATPAVAAPSASASSDTTPLISAPSVAARDEAVSNDAHKVESAPASVPAPAAVAVPAAIVAPVAVASAVSAASTPRSNEAPVTKAPNAEHAPEKVASIPKGLLVLSVHKDSWVEVKAGKNALISRLMRAGSTEQVEITEAASLTLGNAAGVEASFRGRPIDIKAEAKNNVVHLSLQ